MHHFNSKMIIQVHISRNFIRKYLLPSTGFKPLTFWLVFSYLGITFLSGMCISPINSFVPRGCSGVILRSNIIF